MTRSFEGWNDLVRAEFAGEIPNGGYAIALGVSGDLPNHWMPNYIAWHERTAAKQTSAEDRVRMDAWCKQHCTGLNRHLFKGVFEFENREDMERFAAAFPE